LGVKGLVIAASAAEANGTVSKVIATVAATTRRAAMGKVMCTFMPTACLHSARVANAPEVLATVLEDGALSSSLARRRAERNELAAAKQRIRELEAELAIHRRASELLAEHSDPKGSSRRSR
jgi:hypothetical protein